MIASEPGAPAVDIGRPWVIEVMDSPIATIVNATKGITYQPAADRWNTIIRAASHGDIIEISPGAVHQALSDMDNYFNGLDSCMLAVSKVLTIRNMRGRGRWWLWNGDEILLNSGRSGIVVFSAQEMDGVRGDITIEGFAFDNWGQRGDSNGIKFRTNYTATGTWTDYHRSATIRNFKLGKRPYYRSGSGISGAVETLTIEDGHVYDCGAGLNAGDGQDHNFYISARTLNIRGVRSQRSRGNTAAGWWAGGSDMDGHHMKVSAVAGTIEGCVLDSDPVYGDNSAHIQCKAGGNFTIRGNLLIGSAHTQNEGQGMIVMTREYGYSGNPNFETWWAGSEGNSLLVEKNVFVNHYGKPLVYFAPPGTAVGGYMAVGTGADQISSVTIRDNIGMVASTLSVDAPFVDAKWIKNDPTGGPAWAANNSVMNYSADESGFDNRLLLAYTRTGGPIPGTAGAVAISRFQFPHGYVARTDSNRGLG